MQIELYGMPDGAATAFEHVNCSMTFLLFDMQAQGGNNTRLCLPGTVQHEYRRAAFGSLVQAAQHVFTGRFQPHQYSTALAGFQQLFAGPNLFPGGIGTKQQHLSQVDAEGGQCRRVGYAGWCYQGQPASVTGEPGGRGHQQLKFTDPRAVKEYFSQCACRPPLAWQHCIEFRIAGGGIFKAGCSAAGTTPSVVAAQDMFQRRCGN